MYKTTIFVGSPLHLRIVYAFLICETNVGKRMTGHETASRNIKGNNTMSSSYLALMNNLFPKFKEIERLYSRTNYLNFDLKRRYQLGYCGCGEQWSRGRAPECQSRGRWFNHIYRRFETWAISFTRHFPVSFGRYTKSLRSLLFGVYARGSKSNSGGKCVTCSGLTNSSKEQLLRLGCLEITI